jgi:hypothetical protein
MQRAPSAAQPTGLTHLQRPEAESRGAVSDAKGNGRPPQRRGCNR